MPDSIRSALRRMTLVCMALGATWAASSGCRSTPSRSEAHELLETIIPEAERRAALSELLERRDREQDEYWSGRLAQGSTLAAAAADYGTSSEELAELGSQFDPLWEGYRDSVITISLEMRERMTETEWREFAATDIDSLLIAPPRNR